MTTDTAAPARLTYTFDAALFARGWLSAELAASRDTERIMLCQAVCVEVYEAGVQLLASDGSLLLRAWVPNLGALEAAGTDTVPRPGLDEVPESTAVALDPHGRARAMLAYVLKAATAKDAPPMTIECSIGPSALNESDDVTFDGMETLRVGFEFRGSERLELATFEGSWFAWRPLFGSWEGEQTTVVALNPGILGRLVKLGGLHGNLPLVWGFGGEDAAATVEVRNAMPAVDGMVMPIRLSAAELERVAEDEPPAG